ncbi:sigma-54-dependent transcriptional regulator [Pseudoalteromonas xiamenensis]|uniref:sigma-54-dependent transcriptional regulator n=1 Tax=Pseudoalteromonas xiamenensis TaxID=882626 RepID=UPI0035E74AFA
MASATQTTAMTATILIIDDKPDVRLSARFLLSNYGYQIEEADSPAIGLARLAQKSVDLVLLDMNFALDTTSGAEGLYFLDKLAAFNESNGTCIAAIAMTAWANTELIVQALHKGASDFIEKPWDNKRLVQIIDNTTKVSKLKRSNLALEQQLQDAQDEVWLNTQSPVMHAFLSQLERVAKTQANVLLIGENGTGKSSFAQYLHQQSSSHGAFVSVNMAAITETLFESEMFGHVKGAFTGADKARIGRFELAKEGTLFLDEVAATPISQQAKLLRVLESGEFEKVGSSHTMTAKPRIVSASNEAFETLIKQGVFRQDLFFRLNTVTLKVPALRERREDIPMLAKQFLAKHGQTHGVPKKQLSSDAERYLSAQNFAGNLRELSQLMERLVILTSDIHVTPDMIAQVQNPNSAAAPLCKSAHAELPLMTIDEAEQQLLKLALTNTNGNTENAATILGLSKSAIYRRLEKYQIVAKDFQQKEGIL